MPIALVGIGDVVAGKYRIDAVIGAGGMGMVFRAHHELLDVAVAVKVLPATLMQTPGIVDRFLREARAIARLRSEHVARVMDAGALESGQPYIVMELLEGEDLRERLGRLRQLPVQQAVDYVMQTLEAMAHAHAAGIVHRDLKPENLFVAITTDGREVIRVLDFGIAKLSQANRALDAARLTAERTALGSPHYMAPEQVRDSSQLDHRADIWAVGTILYELVAGVEAFPGGSVGEIFGAVLHSTPIPLRALRPDVPEPLEAVVARCLTRDIAGRFASVAELARALAPFASREGSALAERVEQTLSRPQRLSDPMIGAADSGPISVGKMRGRFSSVPAAPSSWPPERSSASGLAPVRSERPLLVQPESVASETAPPGVGESGRNRRWTRVLALALVAACAAPVLVHFRTRAHETPRVVALAPIETAPLAPRPTASVAPDSPGVPVAPSAAPTVAAPPSDVAPAPGVSRRNRPSVHPAAAPPPKLEASSTPHLPSVLGSAD
jgi:serine/threonine-protein kinase